MDLIKNLKALFANIKFENQFKKLVEQGIIKPFDEKFYEQFENMYYLGLPVYYYLQRMNMGKCYDASAVLGFAFGKDCYICRGELNNIAKCLKEPFGHGWVEKDGYVYDTTWQIICPTQTYYKLFGTGCYDKQSHTKFFEDCKNLSDWTIHNKEYYETNPNSAYLMVLPAMEGELKTLESGILTISTNRELIVRKITQKDREFIEKLLKDLPDIEKLYKQIQIYHSTPPRANNATSSDKTDVQPQF